MKYLYSAYLPAATHLGILLIIGLNSRFVTHSLIVTNFVDLPLFFWTTATHFNDFFQTLSLLQIEWLRNLGSLLNVWDLCHTFWKILVGKSAERTLPIKLFMLGIKCYFIRVCPPRQCNVTIFVNVCELCYMTQRCSVYMTQCYSTILCLLCNGWLGLTFLLIIEDSQPVYCQLKGCLSQCLQQHATSEFFYSGITVWTICRTSTNAFSSDNTDESNN